MKTGHYRGLSNGPTLRLLCVIQLGIAGFYSTQNVVCPKDSTAFWHLYSNFYFKPVQELLTQYQKTSQKNKFNKISNDILLVYLNGGKNRTAVVLIMNSAPTQVQQPELAVTRVSSLC